MVQLTRTVSRCVCTCICVTLLECMQRANLTTEDKQLERAMYNIHVTSLPIMKGQNIQMTLQTASLCLNKLIIFATRTM